MLIESHNGATGYSGVFEDDGNVAYAYLLDNGRIVADVWLYNRAPTPEAPEWHDRSNAPFLNPRRFTSEVPFLPPANECEVEFSWSKDAEGRTTLRVLIRGECHALLVPDSKPGWCKLATKDGPLASVLT
jgi:hypothetical protein